MSTDSPVHAPHAPRLLRARAVVLALLLAFPTVYWIIYVEVVKYCGYPTTTSLFYNVVAALFLVRVLADLLRRTPLRGVFSESDLRVVYVVLALVSAGASLDFTQNLMGIISYPNHYASPENRYAEELLPHVPQHLLVAKGPSSVAFWQGGATITPETLSGFREPLAWWGLFCMLLLLAGGGMVMLLHRRWSQAEHLTYPILEVPMALSAVDKPLWSGRLFLIGFLTAAGIETLNSLNAITPHWPQIPVRAWHPPFNLAAQVTDHPWRAIGYMPLSFYPFAIGQGLLLPTDLSFSCWFFYLQWQAQKVLTAWLGWNTAPGAPFIREQSFGGFLGLALFALWVSRRGWLRELRAAWSGSPAREGRDARVAVGCIALGFAGLVWFSCRAGMTASYAIPFFALYFLVGIAVTRIRAEMGLPVHDLHFSGPTQMLPTVLSARVVGRRNLAVGELYYWFNRAYRSHFMPHQAEGFRFLEGRAGLPAALLLLALAWGVGVALSFGLQLKMVFHAGGAAGCVSTVPQWIGREPWQEYMGWIDQARGPNGRATAAILVGILVTSLGMAGTVRSGWWPVHPVGYAVSSSWAMERLWCPMLIAWLVKSLVTRYGGGAQYRRTVHLAVGLIVGDFVTGSLWNIYGILRQAPIYRFWD